MAKKRSRQAHTGSVYQSGGQWYAAVMVHGRRRRIRCSSKAEANAKRQELCEAAAAGASLDATSFGVFRIRWLDQIRSSKAAKTVESYEYALKHFDSLREIPLDRVSAPQIQQILDGLSGRTRQQAFDKVRQIFRQAIRWKCAAVNPVDLLDRPSHTKKTIDPFELSEVRQIIEHLNGTRYGAAARLAFACGLRGGELWGLQWKDWKDQELTIQRQACETSGAVEIKAPKTEAGIRRILLPDSVVDAIQDRQRQMLRDGLAACPWMFPGETGSVTRRSNFGYRVWGPALETLKLRKRGFHHVRHTAATLLLNSGVPLPVVSRTLGHASPAITLSTYAHVMVSDLTKFRDAFDRAIG